MVNAVLTTERLIFGYNVLNTDLLHMTQRRVLTALPLLAVLPLRDVPGRIMTRHRGRRDRRRRGAVRGLLQGDEMN